jgi:farnesyl-diphosphate farnesyltransferase
MRALGRAYGSGLQLINILRDMGADLAARRCYLPADALAAAGLTPADLARDPAHLAHLAPVFGARTLALLRQAGPGALHTRVKVPRHEVRAILLRLAVTLAARGPLQAGFIRLRG